MVKKVKKQATYDMQEDTPVPEAASAQTGVETEPTAPQHMPAPASNPVILKPKTRKRGQQTATQQSRKLLKFDKALGVADKKSTKAIKLSSAKQRKQHAKGLWSKND
ncbi:hypothetical protein WJX79_007964 [Trebouxia sp. C0005]